MINKCYSSKGLCDICLGFVKEDKLKKLEISCYLRVNKLNLTLCEECHTNIMESVKKQRSQLKNKYDMPYSITFNTK